MEPFGFASVLTIAHVNLHCGEKNCTVLFLQQLFLTILYQNNYHHTLYFIKFGTKRHRDH